MSAAKPRRVAEAALLLAALVALPGALATLGASGPRRLQLNLGPGDRPYVSGFAPEYEIEDTLARHWSKRRATLSLPLTLSPGAIAIVFRFGPPPLTGGEAAGVAVTLGGVLIDRFSVGPGGMQIHRTEAALKEPTPLSVGLTVSGAGPANLGLWMDWLAVELGPSCVATLSGRDRGRAPATVGLFFLVLLGVGCRARRAALVSAPFSLVAAIVLARDPWLAHRFLTGIPEALLFFGLPLVIVCRATRRRAPARGADLELVGMLLAAGFLLRALALNTPDYYHPDLRSHARLALAVRKAGWEFLANPVEPLRELGLWQYRLGERFVTFPYSPAFHVPLALSDLEYDSLLTAEKLLGAALSTLPIALVFMLARCIGASPLGAALLLVAPIYGRHLAVAFLPALFGHVFDLALLSWLAAQRERLTTPRVWLTSALLVAACQLAYASALSLVPALLVTLAAVMLAAERGPRLRAALAILGFGLAGSALSVLVYYRHFLALVPRALPLLAESPLAPSEASEGFFLTLASLTRSNFALLPLSLAAIGFALLLRAGSGRVILVAWASAYLLLVLARAALPGVFRLQHEALFVAPLVFLAAGEPIARLWAAGGWRRALAVCVLCALVGQGLYRQLDALLGQRGYAL